MEEILTAIRQLLGADVGVDVRVVVEKRVTVSVSVNKGGPKMVTRELVKAIVHFSLEAFSKYSESTTIKWDDLIATFLAAREDWLVDFIMDQISKNGGVFTPQMVKEAFAQAAVMAAVKKS